MKSIILKGENICKTFKQGNVSINILNNLNIEIFKGDFTVIMGPSGAGKSTLLYALSGMDKLTSGSVTYKENNISNIPESKLAKIRANEFGFVFQQTHLVSNLSLLENVTIAGFLDKSRSEKEIKEKALSILNKINVSNAQNRLPNETSGGESQRAAIARAIINNPELLFTDEPTGALNRKNSEEVFSILTDLNRNNQSILMVTHDPKAAIRGNRILYIEDGKILDELKMEPFTIESAKDREIKVNNWLTELSW